MKAFLILLGALSIVSATSIPRAPRLQSRRGHLLARAGSSVSSLSEGERAQRSSFERAFMDDFWTDGPSVPDGKAKILNTGGSDPNAGRETDQRAGGNANEAPKSPQEKFNEALQDVAKAAELAEKSSSEVVVEAYEGLDKKAEVEKFLKSGQYRWSTEDRPSVYNANHGSLIRKIVTFRSARKELLTKSPRKATDANIQNALIELRAETLRTFDTKRKAQERDTKLKSVKKLAADRVARKEEMRLRRSLS